MVSELSLTQLLPNATQRFGDQPAIIEKQGWLTYAQLRNRVEHTAEFLVSHGVSRGQTVGFKIKDPKLELILKLALLDLGVSTLLSTPRWVWNGSGHGFPARFIMEVGAADDDERILQLPNDLGHAETPRSPGRLSEGIERLYVVPSRNPADSFDNDWLSDRVVHDRVKAVVPKVRPGERVAFSGLSEPTQTIMQLGALAQGAAAVFLSTRRVVGNLARYGIERLFIDAAGARRMTAPGSRWTQPGAQLAHVNIHGRAPSPGLTANVVEQFGCRASYSVDDRRIGPIVSASDKDLESAPLGLHRMAADLHAKAGDEAGDKQAEGLRTSHLLIKPRSGRWYDSKLLAMERPDQSVLLIGRAERATEVGTLKLDLRFIEGVLSAHEGVEAVMVIAEPTHDESPNLLAMVVADQACADSVLSYGRRHLGLLAPKRVIQVDLPPSAAPRHYLRYFIGNLRKGMETLGGP